VHDIGRMPRPDRESGRGGLSTRYAARTTSTHRSTRAGAARKRLPPYGRDLVARVDAARRRGSFHGIAPCSVDGRHADCICYGGPDGMRWAARETRLHLALPYRDDPSWYRWPVRNLAVAIIWIDDPDRPPDGAVILALGHELAAAGAHIVLDVQTGGPIDG